MLKLQDSGEHTVLLNVRTEVSKAEEGRTKTVTVTGSQCKGLGMHESGRKKCSLAEAKQQYQLNEPIGGERAKK